MTLFEKPTAADQEIARRPEALRRARANSLVEGLRVSEEGDVVLDAYARGDIDIDEALRRLDTKLNKQTSNTTEAA